MYKTEIQFAEIHIYRGADMDEIFKALTELSKTQGKMMTKISDFAAAQGAFNTQLETALTGIGGDITTLNAKITELQNTPGQITPEDQTLLDAIQAQGQSLADRFTAVDALTAEAPVIPPVEPQA
jgi:hypothetical protein